VPLKIATVESRKTHTARKIHANLLQAARLVPASEIGTVQHKAYEWLARAGYAAEGCVYVIMGGLAVLAALGAGGRVTGAKGALVALLSQPFGFVLLGIVAFGLVCLTLWRIAQSILDASMIAWPRAAPAETGVVVAQRQPCVVRTHPARHRVDRGSVDEVARIQLTLSHYAPVLIAPLSTVAPACRECFFWGTSSAMITDAPFGTNASSIAQFLAHPTIQSHPYRLTQEHVRP